MKSKKTSASPPVNLSMSVHTWRHLVFAADRKEDPLADLAVLAVVLDELEIGVDLAA